MFLGVEMSGSKRGVDGRAAEGDGIVLTCWFVCLFGCCDGIVCLWVKRRWRRRCEEVEGWIVGC